MIKPEKQGNGWEERFDEWRNDGEHESWSDKNGYIDIWDIRMVKEFIVQELMLKELTDFGILQEELTKAKSETQTELDKGWMGWKMEKCSCSYRKNGQLMGRCLRCMKMTLGATSKAKSETIQSVLALVDEWVMCDGDDLDDLKGAIKKLEKR